MTLRAIHATATLCAALLLTAPLTSCQHPAPAKGFALRREEPAPADREIATLLDRHRITQTVTADLNTYLDLPHRIEVATRSCAGGGSGYDPGTRRIELCYDDLTEDHELFERAGDTPADDPVAAVARETLYHEAGHALIDTLGLPAPDDRAEEDAADRFAQLMLLRDGRPEGERTLLAAARAYDLAAAAHPEPDPEDEHAPDPARAESHRCATYGAAPARHPTLATPPRTPCPHTWTTTRAAWLQDLAPVLRT
ncbi:DUF4344 domain-containing metallopeptidase [Streptomyces sp. WM6373]|uniref:DUF4344 domain-containing metallopeptidase n=1 Tax=Streptomyces sp. WM6373 TaxID=1415556 RepID=UPI0006AEE6E8|nr:DUF4344 domain-containing metallopeptidase [Streptomyces sp. WM6373]